MDIHNLIMDIHNWIVDIRNWIMDIHNSIVDRKYKDYVYGRSLDVSTGIIEKINNISGVKI